MKCRQLSVVLLSTYSYLCGKQVIVMDINTLFGANVKKRRLTLGISQETLANRASVDRTYIPDIEKGQRNVSLVVAEKIAKALEVKLSDLI